MSIETAIRCAAMRARYAAWPLSGKVLFWLLVLLFVVWPLIAFVAQRTMV